jgi:glyoxalase family protein
MSLPLLGIHHVTAVTARASDNLRFYTQVLGMRLVKKTVNQDDVSAYHLFYADAKGSPGTDLTFFDWAAHRDRTPRCESDIARMVEKTSRGTCPKSWGNRGACWSRFAPI